MGYRAGVPHIEEPVRNAADLSQTRRDHPRPRLLQLPRPGAEKGTGGPHRFDGRSRAMGVLARDPRRPRLADRDRGRTGREAFRPALAAPPRRELGAARRRRRPAAHRASAPRRLTRSRQPNPNRSATALFQRRFVFAIRRLQITTVEDQSEGVFTLRSTGDTPFFHHVAILAELRKRSQAGTLYTYHFNALRSILEKTASFLGHDDLRVCLAGLEDEVVYNRALNLMSHSKYAINEPVEMVHDNKELFRRILDGVLDSFQFALPELDTEAAPR